ncbi:hypothetical protein G6F47_007731 [Rhizopus delemar]|nr:hypothetical protein G6F43_006905 [Rhizopus delemar]KAG1500162.1 hypothetical protein G6F54_003905 [Rhizopus delemar]KAG1511362.1 hypothetical protein G6F53_005998 [Rhizopus delemar]KAG1554999.1 hypothetical protein G6F49_007539 [Rhizopus delemar]KAG1596961.1 hypothetical protein G6F47_007731 [Rhizopus delemar]
MTMALTSLVVAAQTTQTATVFWLHGRNNSSAGFAYLPQELGDLFPYVKWVLPDAPFRNVTFAGGERMRAWFDITGLDDESLRNANQQDMLDSVDAVNRLVGQEVNNGIRSDRIVIGGFSQGAAISLLTGLRSEHRLAGVVSYSGFLGMENKTRETASEANRKTPFLLAHGTQDQSISYRMGQAAARKLKSLHYQVNLVTYPNQTHIVSDEEVELLARFLKKVIPFK